MSLLQLRGVGKEFVSANGMIKSAVQPVDLDITPGEFVSLVGPSGCGKTTLLKIMAGLITPTTGTITAGEGDRLRPRDLGMVFQSAALLPWRTIRANVQLPAEVLRLPQYRSRERVDQLLSLVRLDGVAEQYPGELSGGMQQRAAIARALLHDPSVLFMDEPFGALDAFTREELALELQRIHSEQRTTVVFVTHDIGEAIMLSDRIVVMSASPGRVVEVIDVDLPRPRGIDDLVGPRAATVATHIRALLGHRGQDAA